MLRRLIAAANGAERRLRRIGFDWPSLDADTLIETAHRTTGLGDFGDDSFRAGLRLLLEGCEREAALNFAGRMAAHFDSLRLLQNRLRIEAFHARHPQAAAAPLARPLFITGLPRSGTTFLHNLLRQDPASRAPEVWEAMYPLPPSNPERHGEDPRIARASRALRWFERLAPDFSVVHEVRARAAQECIALMSLSFMSPQFHATFRLPRYESWLDEVPSAPAYAYHRRVLQALAWGWPERRWVLKAPAHLGTLDALLACYPDALIVHTHRDPQEALASVASLSVKLHSAFSDRIEPRWTGQQVLRRWSRAANKAIAARSAGPAAGRVLDVPYAELVRNPLAVVERIYARFDLPLGDAARHRINLLIGKSARRNTRAHRYALGDFGLDADAVRNAFAPYYAFFDFDFGGSSASA